MLNKNPILSQSGKYKVFQNCLSLSIGWFWNCSLSQNLSNLTYQWRCIKPKVHRRSICMPRNCDFSNWNRGSRGVIFSLIFSRLLIWFLSLSPSWGLGFCRLPSFSIAIWECKKELPGKKRKITLFNLDKEYFLYSDTHLYFWGPQKLYLSAW